MATTNIENIEWISVEDLKNEFGFSPMQQSKMRMAFVDGKNKYIRTLIKPLPYRKIGRTVLYNRAEVFNWLELHSPDLSTYKGKKRGRKPKVATENKENKND